jgi:CRP/FNR family cyclic AMP-dependent transcriptional regulator
LDVFQTLRQSQLLSDFTDDGVRIIQAATTPRVLPAGAPIFVEKMMSESAFILVEGRVTLLRQGPHGERALATLDAPDSFGELALLAQGPRRISARAETSVALLEITRRDFHNLQKQRPQACMKLLMAIVERFSVRMNEAAPLMEHMIDAVTG